MEKNKKKDYEIAKIWIVVDIIILILAVLFLIIGIRNYQSIFTMVSTVLFIIAGVITSLLLLLLIYVIIKFIKKLIIVCEWYDDQTNKSKTNLNNVKNINLPRDEK